MFVLQEEFTKKVLEIISQYEPTEEELSSSDGEKENGNMDIDDNNSVKLKQDPDAKSMYCIRNKSFRYWLFVSRKCIFCI